MSGHLKWNHIRLWILHHLLHFNISTSVFTMNLYQFQCLFLFHNTSGYTSKQHLNFMHVTELQHCQNRSQTAVTNTGFAFPMFICSSKLALQNRFVHPRPNLVILIGWSQLLLFTILPYKSDSPFNITNVAIISYSTAIRPVSNLASLSYAYLLLFEKRPNFLILIGLVCIAKFLNL